MTDKEFGYKAALTELRNRLDEIMPPGSEIGRAEILAMIDDRLLFPRLQP